MANYVRVELELTFLVDRYPGSRPMNAYPTITPGELAKIIQKVTECIEFHCQEGVILKDSRTAVNLTESK